MDPKSSRGYLNHNPGNIDRSPNYTWNEEIRDPNDARLTSFQRNELTKGRFAVFPSAYWGIRALVLNLRSYQDKLGLKSIRAMINRWAPPNENHTENYITRVANSLKVTTDEPVNMRDYNTAFAMADAIIRVECAGMPYDNKTIEEGLRLAGTPKPLTQSATVRGAAVAGGGTGTTFASDQIQSTVDTLTPIADSSNWMLTTLIVLKIVGVIITLAGIGWILWERFGRADRDRHIEDVPDTALPDQPVPAGAKAT